MIYGLARDSLYKYRSETSQIFGNAFIERQWFEFVFKSETQLTPALVLLGSSAVVDGIAEDQIDKASQDSLAIVKYGASSFLASELGFAAEVLPPKTRSLAYFYNSFSFANSYLPKAPQIRWRTAVFLRTASASDIWEQRELVVHGLFSDHLRFVQFRETYLNHLGRWLKGDLQPFAYPYNRPSRDSLNLKTLENLKELTPDDQATRRMYEESIHEDSLGYRQFEAFLAQMELRSIQLAVVPMPEPTFAADLKFRRGLRLSDVDRNVREICLRFPSITCTERAELKSFEADPNLFEDHLHFNGRGRNLFTTWLLENLSTLGVK